MPVPSSVATITMHLSEGTLYATPNGGHARALEGTSVRWAANFPFRIEFSTLTGGAAPSEGASCGGSGPGYEFVLTLPAVADGEDAPAFKYTIHGDGEARGRVLDPIVIVDKHR